MLENRGTVFWRRVRLYLFGVCMGLIGCYFIFGVRGCKWLTPGMLKLDQISTRDSIQYSDTAICLMKCQHISKSEVMESFTYGKVDTKKSESFHVRNPIYNFTGLTKNGRNLNVICMERDSTARILYVNDLAMKDSCPCQ